MILFKMPNYRVQVSEIKYNLQGGQEISSKKSWRYCYAANEDDAIALITTRNRYVHIYRNTLRAWEFTQKWDREVKEVIARVGMAVRQGERPDFPSRWSKLKEHLADLFDSKCAYCEAKFTPVSFGDVEHYRPKGSVSEDPNHKGYYWLAYNPANYLPACQLCNEPAKKDHFPIKGVRAYSERDSLDAEDPLLINPYTDHYEDHLEFVPSTYSHQPNTPPLIPGAVIGKTEKGWNTIKTMELYREAIRQEREREMAAAHQDIKTALGMLTENRDWPMFLEKLKKTLSAGRPFQTAVYYEVRHYLMEMEYWDLPKVQKALAEVGYGGQ
jgi:hypothetical protein